MEKINVNNIEDSCWDGSLHDVSYTNPTIGKKRILRNLTPKQAQKLREVMTNLGMKGIKQRDF